MTAKSSDRIRVTVSLNRELVDQIDGLIDGSRIRNRSHAVEQLVAESLGLMQLREAVLLAGGESVEERLPAIEQMLDTLSRQGIAEVILVTGYLGQVIRERVGDGSRYGLRVEYAQSDQGSGGALRELRPRLQHTFLVVNVDEPLGVNLKHLLRFHREHRPIATLATTSLRELRGVYVLEPSIFGFIPEGFSMLEESVFHEVAKQGKLLSYPINNP